MVPGQVELGPKSKPGLHIIKAQRAILLIKMRSGHLHGYECGCRNALEMGLWGMTQECH